MRRFAAILAMILPMVSPVLAVAQSTSAGEDVQWVPLDGAQIRTALTGRTLEYKSAWQDFRDSGRTLYVADRESWGYWRVENDQYCSQWPPSNLWACYGMAKRGDALRFIGRAGDTTDGTYRE